MATIITTTGISLHNNTKKETRQQQPSDDEMKRFLRREPEKASAEVKSLLQIAQPDDNLVLLHTGTLEAIRCAILLQDYFLSDQNIKHVRLIKLEFQEDEAHIETQGIRNFVDTLITEIEKAQNQQDTVIINATAGFKAQIVYSTMLGMLYHVPVKYIYEGFQRIVTFNPIPLDWDTSIFLSNGWFFRWIDEDIRTIYEVEQKLQQVTDAVAVRALLTPPDKDGCVFLSAMGIALQRKLEYEIAEAELIPFPPVSTIEIISEKVANSILQEKHHFPKNLRDDCLKIAQIPYVQGIVGGFFENTTRSQIKQAYPDGTISLIVGDGKKVANLTVRTTAQGKPQTLKVAMQISQLLDIPMMSEKK